MDQDEPPSASAPASFLSRPVSNTLKGVLKQRRSPPSPSTLVDPPQPSASGDTTPADGTPSAPRSSAKRVRVVEPSVEALDELRAQWASMAGQSKGAGGIGGFRRTRDFYSKSQGGSAVIKRSPTARGVPLTPGESDPEDRESGSDSESDETCPPTAGDTPTPIGRPQLDKLSPTPPARASSLSSPTRAGRARDSSLPRTASGSPAAGPAATLGSGPRSSSPAFIASRPGTRRRTSNSSAQGERSASPSSPLDSAAQPKWLKKGKKGKAGKGGAEVVVEVPATAEEDAEAAAPVDAPELEFPSVGDKAILDAVALLPKKKEGEASPASHPLVTATPPSVPKPMTPVATSTRVTRSNPTPSPPSALAGVPTSSPSPVLPRRSSSIRQVSAAADRPVAGMLGRGASFEESEAPRALVA